jgi:hypothetical protein
MVLNLLPLLAALRTWPGLLTADAVANDPSETSPLSRRAFIQFVCLAVCSNSSVSQSANVYRTATEPSTSPS